MKKPVGLLACALGFAAFAAPASAAGTDVAINSWHVYTKDDVRHKVEAGGTFKSCASNPTKEIYAKGKVTGAKKDVNFDEIWSLNGNVDSIFHEQWLKTGDFTDYFGYTATGGSLKTGDWSVKLVQGTKTIGKSSITIKKKPGC